MPGGSVTGAMVSVARDLPVSYPTRATVPSVVAVPLTVVVKVIVPVGCWRPLYWFPSHTSAVMLRLPPQKADPPLKYMRTWSGSFDAATNKSPVKAVPKGVYGLIGDASSVPVRPLNTFTWADTPAPVPTTMSANSSSSTNAVATRTPAVMPDPNGLNSRT